MGNRQRLPRIASLLSCSPMFLCSSVLDCFPCVRLWLYDDDIKSWNHCQPDNATHINMVLVLRISLESEPCRLSSSAFHFIQQVKVGCSKGSRMWNTVANSVKIWVKYREEIQRWPGAKCVSPILAGSSSVKQTGDVTGSHLSLPREPLARIYCVGGEIQEYSNVRWKEEIV